MKADNDQNTRLTFVKRGIIENYNFFVKLYAENQVWHEFSASNACCPAEIGQPLGKSGKLRFYRIFCQKLIRKISENQTLRCSTDTSFDFFVIRSKYELNIVFKNVFVKYKLIWSKKKFSWKNRLKLLSRPIPADWH